MTLLPIVGRELRVAARRRSTYWIRFSAGVAGLLIAAWALLMFSVMGMQQFTGPILFGGLTSLAFVYAFIAGTVRTADTLSEEKREGTLGLLFLTDLKGHDVVLGKMMAASVNWVFGLLAIFPILALPLLVGGVSPGMFWRSLLALANLLFFSLSLGMLVSALSLRERKAAAATFLLMLVIVLLPDLLASWHHDFTGAAEPPSWLIFPNPVSPTQFAEPGSRVEAMNYWGSLATTHLIAWLLLGVASGILPRVWQQTGGRPAWVVRFRLPGARRRLLRDGNPFCWLAARTRTNPALIHVVLLTVFAMHLIDWADSNDTPHPVTLLWSAFLCHAVLKIWLPFEACRRFIDDRRSGALELLLTTPLTEREMIAGQFRALWQQFIGPAIVVLVFDVFLSLICAAGAATLSAGACRFFGWAMVAGVIVFVIDMLALSWLGMWLGLRAGHVYRAMLQSVLIVLVVPWVAFLAVLSVGAALFSGGVIFRKPVTGPWSEWMPEMLVGLWFAISVVTAALAIRFARRKLWHDFRTQVAAGGTSSQVRKRQARAIPAPQVSSASAPAGHR